MEEHKSRYELFLEEEERKSQPQTKRCPKCGEVKALNEYYRQTSRCKACIQAKNRTKRKYKNAEDRFWKFFHAHTHVVGDCLEWTGRYSKVRDRPITPVCSWDRKKRISTRRVVYQLRFGTLFDDDAVSTTCRNSKCVKQSHLRKMTQEEFDSFLRNNAAAGERHGTYTKPETRQKGELNGFAKLTESEVRSIRDLHMNGVSYPEIAQQYKIYHGNVGKIVRREIWKHVE